MSEAFAGLRVAANGVHWLAVPGWERFEWLWAGFSTRKGGVSRAYLIDDKEDATGEMNLGFTKADSEENVLESRARLAEAVTGSRVTPIVAMRQCHSNLTIVVDEATVKASVGHGRSSAEEVDGLMTAERGVLLGVQTADCIPVLVADPEKRVVAGFHAGWRGTVERIVELGVARMQAKFGSEPVNLIAAIGPGIGQCCYTVGGEVRERFGANFAYADALFEESDGEMRLDLIEANRRQLLAAGVAAERISVVGGCTGCYPEWFYSHRMSGGHAGRMMAVIGVR